MRVDLIKWYYSQRLIHILYRQFEAVTDIVVVDVPSMEFLLIVRKQSIGATGVFTDAGNASC